MNGFDVESRVTSTDLVRNFGAWQDRAARSPLYVEHRGRPRFVLLSVELMNALCARADAPHADTTEHLGALVDAYEEAVLLLDRSGVVTHLNHAARTRFSSARRGMPIANLGGGGFLAAASARVSESGTSEAIQVMLHDRPRREYLARFDAVPSGVMIVLRDATAAERLRESEARLRGLIDAVEADGRTATFRLDLRGALVEPSRALATVVQAVHDHLNGVRLVTLVAVADRPRVGEMVDQVLATGVSASDQVTFLIKGDTKRQATLSLGCVDPIGRATELQGALTLI